MSTDNTCFFVVFLLLLLFFVKKKKASRKHAFIILTPLKPHFYMVNWGLQGCTYFFLIFARKLDCGYS